MSLTLRSICKSFHQAETELQILSDLNLEVASGEVVAIVGESGSGKSTLLSLLAGFEFPDRGEIIVNGNMTSNWNESQWSKFRKSSLGFVFQSYYLIPYLNALENVALPLRLNGDNHPESKAQELLQTLGLSERANHLPSEMSGGECQRVAIGRALVHSPSLVLADEPTGSLDVHTGEHVLDILFRILRQRQQTALIVTHSQEVAARCDKILTLKEGKLWSQ